MVLTPGAYKDVEVGANACMLLEPGEYDMKSLTLKFMSQLLFSGNPGDKTMVRIAGDLDASGAGAVAKAAAGPGLGADSVIFYVGGNATTPTGSTLPAEWAATIVSLGDVVLSFAGSATGSFFGKSIEVKADAVVVYEKFIPGP